MTKNIICLILNFPFLILNYAYGADYFKTEVTRWADPNHTPITYEQYLIQHPFQTFNSQRIAHSAGFTNEPGDFVIIVNTVLYPQIQTSLSQYCDDLTAVGYSWTLYTAIGGIAQDIKNLLIVEWEDSAVGALLIGDLPVPWFELYEDFDNNGIPDDSNMVEFPCDLFYIDMDGIWEDEDNDGIYDVHTGNWEPDIWLGRLVAGALLGNEAILVNNYFAKNHAFRNGNLSLPDMALAFIDDDWAGGALDWAQAVEQMWANTNLVSQIDSTTANNYLESWDDNYQHVLLACHSAPTLHAFKESGGSSWGYIFSNQIPPGDPHFLFYNLFACSNCNYVEDNNCGSSYLFTDTYSINVIGSCKTGSMLFFEDYYLPLSEGVTVGEAFRQWFALHGNEPGAQMWARSWFYGMTNLGDPTLVTRNGIRLADYDIIDDGSGATIGDGDGVANNDETLEFSLNFVNYSPINCQDLTVQMSSYDYTILLLDSIEIIPSLSAGDSVELTGFLMYIYENVPDQYPATINLQISDPQGHIWYDNLELIIRAPEIEMVNYDWREISGDGDALLDEGETIGLNFSLKNIGGQECIKSAPYIIPLEGCFLEAFYDSSYYFPLDTIIILEEMITQFLQFPDGYAGIGLLGFEEPSEEFVQEFFYLPGGETVNIFNDCNNLVESGFSYYPLNFNYNCEFSLDSALNVSPPASFRFAIDSTYAPMTDVALELPLINLLPNSQLSFWHRYQIEAGYDGGIVEIWDGENWSLLTPEGGYPGSSVSNGSYPGGPCYNGQQTEWIEANFDLSQYEGCHKVRFRFGSDSGVEGYGWNIDDITIDSSPQGIVDQIQVSQPGEFYLKGNYPNPFNSNTEIIFNLPRDGRVRLAIYDILGRKTVLLCDGIMEQGEHKVNWNAESLASGIYFLKIDFQGDARMKKCLLLK